MFSLIAGTVESLTPVGRRERIVFLGLDGAGKSFLIQNLILLSQKQEICVEIGKTHPTLGLNVSQLASPNNISLLEVGGSPSIRPMWRHYYDDATKFVFILDSSNIDRYDEAYQEFSDFKESTRSLELPTLLVLNKMDLWCSDHGGKADQRLGAFLKNCSKDDTGKLSCFSVSYLEPPSINKVLNWISREDPECYDTDHH